MELLRQRAPVSLVVLDSILCIHMEEQNAGYVGGKKASTLEFLLGIISYSRNQKANFPLFLPPFY